MYDVERLRKNSDPIAEYLNNSIKETAAFKENVEGYELDADVAKKLKKFVEDYVVFDFSAEWCPDCQRNIPVLGLIAEETGLEVNIFGHLMRDPEKPKGYWRVPPSPAEVEEFKVKRIPTIIVLSKEGDKIGEIIESPPEGKSLEEALLDIFEVSHTAQ